MLVHQQRCQMRFVMHKNQQFIAPGSIDNRALVGWVRFLLGIGVVLLVSPFVVYSSDEKLSDYSSQAVIFEQINNSGDFPDAADPESIRYACAEDRNDLAEFFRRQSLVLMEDLVRATPRHVCHVHYLPTVPGFRAHADSDPVTGIVFTFESRSFQARRDLRLGDSLDIAKTLLRLSPVPLEVTLRTRTDLPPDLQRAARNHHFSPLPHHIALGNSPATKENVWAQDYVKSGHVNGRTMALLPRMAFEGDPGNGKLFAPLLDSLEKSNWVRSRLSWDGGDLVFVRDPRNQRRTILFYGNTAKPYWAGTLTDAEYAWVLKTEFGADATISAGDIASHVDYVLNPLPDNRTVLLAKPMTRNYSLSIKALDELLEGHGRVPVLAELDKLYASEETVFGSGRKKALQLLRQAAKDYPTWPRTFDVDTFEIAQEYAQEHCSGDFSDCLTTEGLDRLIRSDPVLAQDWVGAATHARMGEVLPKALIGLLASQLADDDQEDLVRLKALKEHLHELGFDVLEVPYLAGNPQSLVPWAGISFTNYVAIGNQVFMPVFDLGPPELLILADIQRQLPAPFQIVPVYSRYALASNGGVHCVAGTLRSLPGLGELESSSTTEKLRRSKPDESSSSAEGFR